MCDERLTVCTFVCMGGWGVLQMLQECPEQKATDGNSEATDANPEVQAPSEIGRFRAFVCLRQAESQEAEVSATEVEEVRLHRICNTCAQQQP